MTIYKTIRAAADVINLLRGKPCRHLARRIEAEWPKPLTDSGSNLKTQPAFGRLATRPQTAKRGKADAVDRSPKMPLTISPV